MFPHFQHLFLQLRPIADIVSVLPNQHTPYSVATSLTRPAAAPPSPLRFLPFFCVAHPTA
jgi:hypothetical protein